MRRAAGAAALLIVLLLAGPSLALGADDLKAPPGPDTKPAGYRLTERQVLKIADALAIVKHARAEAGKSTRSAFVKGGCCLWQVSYYDVPKKGAERAEIAQVQLDDRTSAVLEAYEGFKVPWTMARGYDGAFGRKVNSPWVWVSLLVLFVLPFIDPRRPFRMLHLDLLVLSGFSLAYHFFNVGQVTTATPIVPGLLLYVLVRALWLGWTRTDAVKQAADPLRLLVPASWLAVAVVFLFGFRIGLNMTNSNVIDVGYAGVIGAHKIVHGQQLYGDFPADNASGDTYGPFNYLVYIPFEQIWPWTGTWNDLPAAHTAALVFDALVLLLLFLLGRRIRGPGLGIVLAYSWAAFPFTTFVSNTNGNDALPTALILAAVLAATSAPARGALIALAGLTKIAPLALAPLFLTHGWDGRRLRTLLGFAAGFLLVAAVVTIPAWLHGGTPRQLYESTAGFQAGRQSPFSIWGLYGGMDGLQLAVQAFAVGLAVAVAFIPRRPDVIGLAALAAAVLVALQLGLGYWFFLYIVWWFPLLMVALLGRFGEPELR